MSENSSIEHLQKLIESYKSQMASAMGLSAVQSIQNHPYHPDSFLPIPHETLNDEKLLEMWPQIEQQILEWRKMVYLMAYLMRAYAEEQIPNLPIHIDGVKLLRVHEQIWPDWPYLQKLRAFCEFTLQHVVNTIQLAEAFVEQIRAYAQENNDLATMEWYAEHGSMYLASSPSVVLGKLFSARFSLEELPLPDERVLMLEQMGLEDRQRAVDAIPRCVMDDKLLMMQQLRLTQLHDKQQSLDWVTNGIMEIRIASARLL